MKVFCFTATGNRYSPSGELAVIRDIRVIDMTTNDLYDPPVT